MPHRPIAPADLARLESLHRQVDHLAAEVARSLDGHLVCGRGCSACCQDGLTVLEIEAELIRARCGDLLRREPAGREGGCAFLDAGGACRVYAWRPYVCRTQGLPLRWFAGQQGEGQGSGEGRDICPLNLDTFPGGLADLMALEARSCWTLGPWEGRLASLQAEATGRFQPVRVALRSLFPGT